MKPTQEQPVAQTKLTSPVLKPLISAEEFLASAQKISVKAIVPFTSDGLSTNQPLVLPPPTPADNLVVTALKARGLYKKPSASFKHEITCPWVNEHTDAKDSGTVYFEPNGEFYIGGFKCQHYHCSERTIKQLLAYLKISVAEVVGGKK